MQAEAELLANFGEDTDDVDRGGQRAASLRNDTADLRWRPNGAAAAIGGVDLVVALRHSSDAARR